MALRFTALAAETVLNRTAIAIFVKTPEFSAVKTRLAAKIGALEAQQFYQLSVRAIEHTVATLCADRAITPFWAVAEKSAMGRPIWSRFDRLHAGQGDLGLCQHSIYTQLIAQYERVILLGADVPQLNLALLQKAIDSLDNHDFAIGPAEDGGYYLFAGKAPIAQRVWRAVEYSCATTAQQLMTELDAVPALLPHLTDVDREADLTPLLEQMPVDSSSQPQLDLRNWLGALHNAMPNQLQCRNRHRAHRSLRNDDG